MTNAGTRCDLSSESFTLQETVESGRGLVATRLIANDTLVLEASDLTAVLVYRDYRKETCAYCFAYDRGTQWKCRDGKTAFVFCSDECVKLWTDAAGEIGLQAWTIIHIFIQNSKRYDESMIDQSGPRPEPWEIKSAWAIAENSGQKIIAARRFHEHEHEHKPKRDEAKLRKCLAEAPSVDPLQFLTSATLVAANDVNSRWTATLALEADPKPYHSHAELASHIKSYHHLLALLPVSLLPFVTKEVCLGAFDRAAHNAFGLRASNDVDEFLGWGVWPSASYFNHSCEPNLRKERHGRTWRFYTSRDVDLEEPLTISYLGGVEVSLDLWQRRISLDYEWSFVCRCLRCAEEEQVLEEYRKEATSQPRV